MRSNLTVLIPGRGEGHSDDNRVKVSGFIRMTFTLR